MLYGRLGYVLPLHSLEVSFFFALVGVYLPVSEAYKIEYRVKAVLRY